MTFTEAEVRYLQQQRVGRLATVAPDGAVQNNPVSFHLVPERGVVDIGGYSMGTSKKFRNVAQGSIRVAFVVDELVSVERQQVRGIELRGWAEALHGQQPYLPGLSTDVLRIHPELVFSWSINPGVDGMERRALVGLG